MMMIKISDVVSFYVYSFLSSLIPITLSVSLSLLFVRMILSVLNKLPNLLINRLRWLRLTLLSSSASFPSVTYVPCLKYVLRSFNPYYLGYYSADRLLTTLCVFQFLLRTRLRRPRDSQRVLNRKYPGKEAANEGTRIRNRRKRPFEERRISRVI